MAVVRPALELPLGISAWMTCSVGMLVFNKLAVAVFPVACSLVALQMLAAAVSMLVFCWSSLHIGSMRDALRWAMVAPFFTGMLLSSILALKTAPMSLVVTFRALSPIVSMVVEQRFYPNPLKVSLGMILAMGLMVIGVCLYCRGLDVTHTEAIFWVALNNFFAIGDRLLQRYMLASDQNPVDISKTGVTLLNNVLGMIPLCFVAFYMNEFAEIPSAAASLSPWGIACVAASCVVGTGISYTGVWVQGRISATSFLVLVNSCKFFIIFIEVFFMHSKQLFPSQILGTCVAIIAGILYGKARNVAEREDEKPLADTNLNEKLLADTDVDSTDVESVRSVQSVESTDLE